MKTSDAVWELLNDVTEQKPWYKWVISWISIIVATIIISIWFWIDELRDNKTKDTDDT